MSQLALVLQGGTLALPRDYSFMAPDRLTKQCRHCGRILPDLCFRRNRRRGGVISRHRPRCVVCEQEIKDAYKREHRHEMAARSVLRSHMRRERKQGLHTVKTLPEYERLTGVTVEWLAAEMRAAELDDGVCPHCGVKWSLMPAQMSVDRTDRSRLLSRSNLVLMCRTGNSQKGTLDARTWEIRRAYWREVNHERERR